MNVRPSRTAVPDVAPKAASPASARPANVVRTSTVAKVQVDRFDAKVALAGPAAIPGVPDYAWTDGARYMNELLTGKVALPPGFADFRHYTPVRVETAHGTRIQNPRGDVSVPTGWGLPTEEFLPAAKSHDLGYDLLRYFGKQGQPLPGSARKAADALFREDCIHEANDHHSGFDKLKFRFLAESYALAVKLNSISQGYGVP